MARENVVLSKSKCFAVCIIQLVQYLRQNRRPYFIIDQIGRSGTSIGANVTEAQHAISEKEFLQKMYIAYKECSETLYWLDLLHASRYIEVEMYYSLSEKCRELEKLLTLITKTTASHLNKKI